MNLLIAIATWFAICMGAFIVTALGCFFLYSASYIWSKVYGSRIK